MSTDPASVPRQLRDVPKEAREYQGQRAGIVSRVLANVVDLAVVVGLLVALWLGWLGLLFLLDPSRSSYPQPTLLMAVVVGGWLEFVYFTTSWATTGRTVGDNLLGLRVVSFRGVRMLWAGALVRAAFCVLFPIGLFWTAVSRQNRSVQDVVLRTSVIYDWVTQGPSSTRPVLSPTDPTP